MNYPANNLNSTQSVGYAIEAPATVFGNVHELFIRLSDIANYAVLVEEKLNGSKPCDVASAGVKGSPDGILPKLRNAAGDAGVELDRIYSALRAIDSAISG